LESFFLKKGIRAFHKPNYPIAIFLLLFSCTFATSSFAAVTKLAQSISASQMKTDPDLPASSSAGIDPVSRLHEELWADRHKQILEEIRGNKFDLLLIGDSITQNWERSDFTGVWQKYYVDRRVLNLGFNADTTANVLWRLQNGEVDRLEPRAAVLSIGVNNAVLGSPPELTEKGIDAIIENLKRKFPQCTLILLSILPGEFSSQIKQHNSEVNTYLAAKYKNDSMVSFVDVTDFFLRHGKLDEEQFLEYRMEPKKALIHPNSEAMGRVAACIEPLLAKILDKKPQAFSGARTK
jgi:lysophospholipase L1-like esterase